MRPTMIVLVAIVLSCRPVVEVGSVPDGPDAGLACTPPTETPEQLLTRIGCELGAAAKQYEGFPPGYENNVWMALKDSQAEVETNIPNVRPSP